MLDDHLTKQELADLRQAPRRARNVREAYRINAVILLGQGRTAADVADALLIDPDTARHSFKRFKQGGLAELLPMNFVGSEAAAGWRATRRLGRPFADESRSDRCVGRTLGGRDLRC